MKLRQKWIKQAICRHYHAGHSLIVRKGPGSRLRHAKKKWNCVLINEEYVCIQILAALLVDIKHIFIKQS